MVVNWVCSTSSYTCETAFSDGNIYAIKITTTKHEHAHTAHIHQTVQWGIQYHGDMSGCPTWPGRGDCGADACTYTATACMDLLPVKLHGRAVSGYTLHVKNGSS